MQKNKTIYNLFKRNIARPMLYLLFDISPKALVKFRYFFIHKKLLNIYSPKTMDEKIQWMKFNFYKNNPLVTQCTDKYTVREYVKKCNCCEILNELHGVYDNADEIHWDELPAQFVIKWNFGCGYNLICRDKNKFDIKEATKKLKKWGREYKNFYKRGAEFHYKDIVPKIIVEKLIETDDDTLPVDYKIYCFNGEPKYTLTCLNRDEGSPDFYFVNEKWELERLNQKGLRAPEGFTIHRPAGSEKLFDYARLLAKPFPFVRADFYVEKGKVIFGELTFTPAGGFDKGYLPETNRFLGDLVKL